MEWLKESELWKFLSKENNRKTLTFIGAIIVALTGGTWTAYVYFSDNNSSPKPHIVAKESSVAAGGNITAGGGHLYWHHPQRTPSFFEAKRGGDS